MMKKTKIVATIGPASSSKEMFAKLLQAGVNVARVNMSHGDYEEHAKKIKNIRSAAKQEGKQVGVLLDLAGPKIRIGDFETATVELVQGKEIILTGKKCIGTTERVYFNYPRIKEDIKPGMTLMLDDGKKRLTVLSVTGEDITTRIEVGGITKGRRGVNIPGAYLSIDSITKKDKEDLAFGISQDVDFVALSFVRIVEDIVKLRKMLNRAKSSAQIIAKIETQEAVEHIEGIIAAADGVMVARGDLAIEIGPQHVPAVQKDIVRRCNALGKPVIVATQMLESMIHSPVPTRAEVSDVANAIFDGADAVMLSEETALGNFPVETVTMMSEIAKQAEHGIGTHRRLKVRTNNIVDSVSASVVHNAEDVGAKAIVAFTESGSTVRTISRFKPQQPIIAFTPYEKVMRQLTLVYGCYSVPIRKFKYIGQVIEEVGPLLVKEKILEPGDRFVVIAGVPFGKIGSTNTMLILTS